MKFKFTGLDLGNIQNIVDQIQEVLTAGIDGFDRLALFWVDRAMHSFQKDFRNFTQNTIKRSSVIHGSCLP